jgi:hypothetical protein
VREPSRADKKERRKRKEKYEGKTNKGKKGEKKIKIFMDISLFYLPREVITELFLSELPGTKRIH